ncbi:TetR/AcrR family transcriptional regulator [Sphaerisporangium sp. NPDC051011]|uniref:TetR/AcrR family transcriptional regulator n=1 Tax=Sphaerisporangium sp. NPDC051011 TaxID=3155792 RepID=UPI0034049D5B
MSRSAVQHESPGSPQSRQSRKRRRTRESILNAAWLCFTKAGVENTSIREIAELADVSEATVYNHFKNRAELIEAVIGETRPRLDEMVEAVDGLGDAEGPLDVLRLFAERVRGEDLEDLQVLRRFRRQMRAVPELYAAHLIRREESTAVLVEALTPRARAVGMPDRSLELLCSAYAAMSESIAAAQTDSSTPDSWADELVHAIELLRVGWQDR